MKNLFVVIVLMMMSLGFSACEKNDYQHPMHRK